MWVWQAYSVWGAINMNIFDLTHAFGEIYDVVKNYQVTKVQAHERYKVAVLAIATAADETRAYLSQLRGPESTDQVQERRLSDLWRHAAVELVEFDRELAMRCELKADYWSYPGRWRRKDIAQARILLKDISQEVHRLITQPIKQV
jgi:hypothetical protein